MNGDKELKVIKIQLEDLKEEIQKIHESTRTRFRFFERSHNFLRSRSRFYYNYHLKPNSTKINLSVLAAYFTATVIFVALQFGFPYLFSLKGRPTEAAGVTYYVSTTGNDTNNGTSEGTPFRTIQKGANVAQAGDTVLVKAGTYNEQVTPANSGTAGSLLT